MNGLAPTVDLNPLIGRQLTQLCFGAWNVAINFDGDIRIVVESAIVVAAGTSAPMRVESFRDSASVLCESIGQDLLDAERTVEGGLAIRFASGVQWTIENSVKEYESFQLHVGNQVFVA
jgi:hypothetical protein